jgi:hypothetical protein
MGVPEEEAYYYQRELEAGRTIVTQRNIVIVAPAADE